MDISLLLEPQAKHQRMYRGDSMYSEQSLLELNAIPCKDCERSFAPKAYVKHFNLGGEPKCKSVFNKKRPVFNSAKARIENNTVLNKDEKKLALMAYKKISRELALKLEQGGTTSKAKDDQSNNNSKWRMDSKSLRNAIRAIRAKRRNKSGNKANNKRGKRARTDSVSIACIEK